MTVLQRVLAQHGLLTAPPSWVVRFEGRLLRLDATLDQVLAGTTAKEPFALEVVHLPVKKDGPAAPTGDAKSGGLSSDAELKIPFRAAPPPPGHALSGRSPGVCG